MVRGTVALVVVPLLVYYFVGYLNHRTTVGPDSVYVPAEPVTDPAQASPDADEYANGWGPDRDTFTISVPAAYAVLNSITDNPAYGDERNFTRIRKVGDPAATFSDDLAACSGTAIEVYLFFDNNAADNLASSAATIHGLTVTVATPAKAGHRTGLQTVLNAKNARSVWDGAQVRCDSEEVQLTYIPGTARLYSHFAQGVPLNDEGFTGGHGLIGSLGADGELPVGSKDGKYLGSGYVLFQMLVTR